MIYHAGSGGPLTELLTFYYTARPPSPMSRERLDELMDAASANGYAD